MPRKPPKNASVCKTTNETEDSIENPPGDESGGSDEEVIDENEDPDDPYNLAAYDDEDQDDGERFYFRRFCPLHAKLCFLSYLYQDYWYMHMYSWF